MNEIPRQRNVFYHFAHYYDMSFLFGGKLNVLKVTSNLEILINWYMLQHYEYQLVSSGSKVLHLLTFTSNCEDTYLNKIVRQNIYGVSYLRRWNRPLLAPKVTTFPLVEQKTCLCSHCQ